MKPNTPTIIPISQVTSFLCHAGARLSHFQDPPGPSVAVEGGWFDGAAYDGVVFTPTVPTTGSTRIDTIVANPDTGVLEIVEGVEDTAAPPTLPEGSLAAPIADVWVVSRANGEVLIENQDIRDRRSVIARPKPSVQNVLIDQVIIHVGAKHGANDGVDLFKVGDTVGPFTCKKAWTNRPNTGLAFDYARSTAVEVQLADNEQLNDKPVTDFFLNVQLYGSAIQSGTSESHAQFVGVTWKRFTQGEYTGNAAFIIEVVASPQDGGTGFWSSKYTSQRGRSQDKNVALHVQLWQRITS